VRATRLIVTAPLLVAALVIAACGSSNSSSTSKNTTGTTSASTGSAALITTKQHGKLGTILAFGPKKLTVYMFEGDHGSTSSCSHTCAGAWPPVTGSPKAGSGAMAGDLGTITRPDGSKQVTYKGHPLYLFAKDGDAGDAYGEGLKAFGADWYVLAPSGKKVDLS
jgi:predicted lipoprotein with Yx(FWY)xxD motif